MSDIAATISSFALMPYNADKKHFVRGRFNVLAAGIEVRGCSLIRTLKDGLTIAGPRLEGDNAPLSIVFIDDKLRHAVQKIDTCTIDIVETFRLLTLASDPDFVVLRLETRDGKVHNFGIDRAGFTHVVSAWNFDLGAMAGAKKSGARVAAAQQKAS